MATNPASAVNGGNEVVVTKTDENGNIDVTRFRSKGCFAQDNLSALSNISFPTTWCNLKSSIKENNKIDHDNGWTVLYGRSKYETHRLG